MLKSITLAENPFEPDSWTEFETDDVCAFLAEKFTTFPDTAKVYHEYVCATNDVTPNSDESIDRLASLPGPFYVVVYPEAAAIPYIIAAIVAAIVAYAIVSGNIPKPKNQGDSPSPNNDLASRQNTARPFARIPDIYGTVRSTPDLLTLPYSTYVENVEIEHCYMCIGRGFFQVFDILDGTTPASSIPGTQVSVYNPYASPNLVGPYVAPPGAISDVYGVNTNVGGVINDTLWSVTRNSGVNGEALPAPGTSDPAGSVSTGAAHIHGVYSGGNYYLQSTDTSDVDFTQVGVLDGESVRVLLSANDGDHILMDFSGEYPVTYSPAAPSVSRIYLDHPNTINSQWNFTDSVLTWHNNASVARITDTAFENSFMLRDPDMTQIWINVVATNGCYQLDSSGNASAVDVQLEAFITPVNSDGSARGEGTLYELVFPGDASKISLGLTYRFVLDTPGPATITLRRVSISPHSQQVSDSLQWKDLYGMTPVYQQHFGDVTTVYSMTRATAGALSVKERKLNLLVQRMLLTRIPGTATFGALAPTNSVAPILYWIARDPQIGNRPAAEIDIDNLYNTAAAIASYFGTTKAAEFCYTFDSNNLTSEEMISAVAQAVFCFAYRQGNLLRLTFELLKTTSTMLFGHRNKVPGSENRSLSFGPANNFDCVQYDYVSPVDDAKITLYVPSQGINPQKITSIGVRNYVQAYCQAWRAWNKLMYGNTSVEFTALQEAEILLQADRILVADNTRSGTQDGEVVSQNVLELFLSQPVVFAPGKSYRIILQGIDGLTESIAIAPGSSSYHVLLSVAPTVALSLTENASVRTLYWVVANDDVRPQAFLVNKREPGANSFTHKITAINYSDNYYARDLDYLHGTIPTDPDL